MAAQAAMPSPSDREGRPFKEPVNAMETAGSAHLREELRARDLEIEGLQAALVNSRVIGAAVGVLMEREGLSYDDAFAILCGTSQDLNIKVREVADQLLYSGALPAEPADRGAATA